MGALQDRANLRPVAMGHHEPVAPLHKPCHSLRRSPYVAPLAIEPLPLPHERVAAESNDEESPHSPATPSPGVHKEHGGGDGPRAWRPAASSIP